MIPKVRYVINDPASILEDAATQSINLSGITSGPNETDYVSITQHPAILGWSQSNRYLHQSESGGGSSPLQAARESVWNGNDHGDGERLRRHIRWRDHVFTRTFTVTVTPVNDPPTLGLDDSIRGCWPYSSVGQESLGWIIESSVGGVVTGVTVT